MPGQIIEQNRLEIASAGMHIGDPVVGPMNEAVEEAASGKHLNDHFEYASDCVAEAGAMLGARVGRGITAIEDVVIGDGTSKGGGGDYNFQSEGAVGLVTHAGIDIASSLARGPGAVLGAGLGLVTSPLAAVAGENPSEWVVNGASLGSEVASKGLAAGASTVAGLGLTVLRLPLTGIKLALTGLGAGLGWLVGGAVDLLDGGKADPKENLVG